MTVVRGRRTVLDDIDFDIPRGQVTGLLGPSGCGKSTLMRAIAGTQAKVTGTLEVLGRPAGTAPLRSRVGYVTQSPSVYGDLTARQNLDYYAAVLDPRLSRADRHDQVARALADVDLTDHADALAGNLSGGQLSRVSLAVALLGTPELLVLDEPTVGLDPVLRRDLWNLFHRLAADRGTTLLVSSHVMDEAERCQRLLLMRAGRILADDVPAALRDRTHSETVEEAFLRLVDAERDAEAARAPGTPGTGHPPTATDPPTRADPPTQADQVTESDQATEAVPRTPADPSARATPPAGTAPAHRHDPPGRNRPGRPPRKGKP
ncbi:ATP-binding cassette domain-containing protein [Streptomyces lycii]|uniref:ATP-binding cassette domain-containing protein n=1 Tax=Streptomyces lycii TaxID=2654337 RepID=A0ABQ7FJN6_9ACTN|nr:ABC transporter ATP-binding protein [Streptomyces lycii]KAF4407453.1 ATP-binding cassette domain-containing protein [Streptomyces lycii]